MKSNHNNNYKSNNLWIVDLDHSMDESYLKDSCKKYSKLIIYIISFIYRYKSKKCENNKR